MTMAVLVLALSGQVRADFYVEVDTLGDPTDANCTYVGNSAAAAFGPCSIRGAIEYCVGDDRSVAEVCYVTVPATTSEAPYVLEQGREISLEDGSVSAAQVVLVGATGVASDVPVTGNGTHRFLSLQSSTISLTVSSMWFWGFNMTGGSGGVFRMVGAYSTVFSNVKFSWNVAAIGAGLSIDESAYITVSSCEFEYNTARAGAGVEINEDTVFSVVSASSFRNNLGTSVGGGGLYVRSSNTYTVVQGCTFQNNSANTNGGAIYMLSANAFTFLLFSSFVANTADSIGGAIFAEQNNVYTSVLGCTFVDNGTPDAFGGTVVFNSFSWFYDIRHCLFQHNRGLVSSALFLSFGSFEVNLQNNTFDNNYSGVGGAVFVNDVSGKLAIRNCTFTGNTALRDEGEQVTRISLTTPTGDVITVITVMGTGGAIVFDDSVSAFEICNSTFVDNVATFAGGAIAMLGLDEGATICNCSFVNNSAAAGGAIFSGEAVFGSVVQDCTMTHNRAQKGSAFYMESLGEWTIQSSVIESNTATESGTLYLTGETQLHLHDMRCTDNTVADSGACIYSTGSTETNISSTAFLRNVASAGSGGAIYLEDAAESVSIVQSTFDGNRAGRAGGAVLASSVPLLLVEDVECVRNAVVVDASSSSSSSSSASSTAATTTGSASCLEREQLGGGCLHVTDVDMLYVNGSRVESNRAVVWGGTDGTNNGDDDDDDLPDDDGDDDGDDDDDDSESSMSDTQVWGGGMHLSYVSKAFVDRTGIRDNVAQYSGGGIFASATDLSVSSADGADLDDDGSGRGTVSNNTASEGGGGGVYWTITTNGSALHVVGALLSSIVRNNTAFYGNNLATPVTSVRLPAEVDGVSAGAMETFVAHAKDAYNQTVLTESGGYVQISVTDCPVSASIGGQSVAITSAGSVAFSSLVVTCLPDTLVHMDALLTTENEYDGTAIAATGDSKLVLRSCKPGEVILDASPERCTACPVGTYWWPTSTTSSSTDGECVSCPSHSTCDGSADLDVDAGYYMPPSNTSVVILACPGGKDSCAGGRDRHNQCGAGNKGPLCAVCEDDYFSSSSVEACNKCGGVREYAVMVVVLMLVLLFAAVYWLWRRGYIHRWLDMKRKSSFRTGERLKLFITFAQIGAQFSFVFGLNYPAPYKVFLSVVNVSNLSVGGIFALSCKIANYDYYSSMLAHTAGPVLLFLLIFCGWLWRRLRIESPSSRELQKLHEDSLSYFLLVAYLVYPSTCTYIFNAFPCDDRFPDGKSFLKSDYSVSCHSDRYADYRAYAATLLAVYPVGVPVLFLSVLWRHRQKLHVAPELVQTVFATEAFGSGNARRAIPVQRGWGADEFEGAEERKSLVTKMLRDYNTLAVCERRMKSVPNVYDVRRSRKAFSDVLVCEYRSLSGQLNGAAVLFEGYRPKLWWFEALECCRRLMLSSLLVLFYPGEPEQILGGITVAMLFIALYSGMRPYVDRFSNTLMLSTLWSLVMQMVLSLMLETKALPAGIGVGIGMVVLNVLPLFLVVGGEYARHRAVLAIEKGDEIDGWVAMTPFAGRSSVREEAQSVPQHSPSPPLPHIKSAVSFRRTAVQTGAIAGSSAMAEKES